MSFYHKFLNLFWPSFCLHCYQKLQSFPPFFCCFCQEDLQLIDTNEFKSNRASCLENMGSASSFLSLLKKEGGKCHYKTAAAIMAVQFYRLCWPSPEKICFLPTSFLEQFFHGTSKEKVLAKELEQFLCKSLNHKSKIALLVAVYDPEYHAIEEEALKLLDQGYNKVYGLTLFY